MLLFIARNNVVTKASPEAVWYFVSDPTLWPMWDHSIDSVRFNQPFQMDSIGTMKLPSGKEIPFKLGECTAPYYYVRITKRFGAQVIFTHELHKEGKATHIRQRVEMTGFLKGVYSFFIGHRIKMNLIKSMNKLIELAQEIKEKKKEEEQDLNIF